MNRKGLIILTGAYGQTSNRLFQHVWLDSFCKEHGMRFYNPFMDDLKKVYPGLVVEPPGKLLQWIARFVGSWKIMRKLFSLNCNDENKLESYHRRAINSRLLFLYGWFFRSPETAQNYRNYYQQIFDPAIDKDNLEREFLTLDSTNSIRVAVHIRRGDYDTFEGGMYYFPDSVYIHYMQKLQDLLHNKCRFIIFSNDPGLSKEQYVQVFQERVMFSEKSVFEDYFIMSECDRIIGPPSTFSMWASYLGEVPRFEIILPDAKISLTDFSICNG